MGSASHNTNRRRRRGAVAAQVLVCSTVILGMGALVIDVGKLHLARTELQCAADSAALAGASAYFDNAGLVQNTARGALARERAQEFSDANWTLGAPTVLAAGDIVTGTLDLSNPASLLDTSGTRRFNAVQVLVRRTAGSSNGSIAYSFAWIFGYSDGGAVAGATAAFDDRFGGYVETEDYGLLMPFSVHKNLYEQALVSGADKFSYDAVLEQVDGTPDGVREVPICALLDELGASSPDGAGNFGLLNIGTGNQGDAALEAQVREGVALSDLELEIGTTEMRFVADDGQPNTYAITGSPGLKVAMSDAVESRVGQVVGFFIHDLVTDPGSNAVYRIVDMRFGRVMHVDTQGNPHHRRVVVQPVAYTGPGVIVITNAPSSNGQVGRLRLVR